MSSPALTRAQPSWPCDKVSWERSWGKTTSFELANVSVAPAQLVLLVQPVQAPELERPRVLGSLHPSTRRDASPALAARRTARRPSLGNPHISPLSSRWSRAPRRGYEPVATSRLTQRSTQKRHTTVDRRERGGAASPQQKAALATGGRNDARRFAYIRLRRPRLS